jgi:PAS domain S-box-containing protein
MTERFAISRTAEEWVRAVEDKLGVGFWTWDIGTARLVASDGLYRMVGLNPAAVHIDLPFLETLVHPADRLQLEDGNSLAVDGRQADRQFRIIRPDGQMRWLRSRSSCFMDRDGAPVRVVAVFSDVTEGRDMKADLSNSRALLHNIATLIEGAVWIADEQGQLLDVFEGGDVADGGNWRASLHPEDRVRVPELWQQAVRNKKPYHFHPRVKHPNGNYRTLQVAGLPFSSKHSSEPYWGGLATANPIGIAVHHEVEEEAAMLEPGQVRACRALLDWTAEMLAYNAGISVSTVRRIESVESPYGHGDSLRLVIQAFRRAGLKIWRTEDGRFCVSDLL